MPQRPKFLWLRRSHYGTGRNQTRLAVLQLCGGSTQSSCSSLHKWPDVYACALVCASSHMCVWGECVVEGEVRE